MEAVSPYVARGLDLNDAWSDEYATDKLTLHLQRLYLSVVLGFASFGKHVSFPYFKLNEDFIGCFFCGSCFSVRRKRSGLERRLER